MALGGSSGEKKHGRISVNKRDTRLRCRFTPPNSSCPTCHSYPCCNNDSQTNVLRYADIFQKTTKKVRSSVRNIALPAPPRWTRENSCSCPHILEFYPTFKSSVSTLTSTWTSLTWQVRHESSGLPIIHHSGYVCDLPANHRFPMAKFPRVLHFLIRDQVITERQVRASSADSLRNTSLQSKR